MEELKTLFSLLIATSIQKLPCLRDYWSSDWVLSVPGFSKVTTRNKFLDIWKNIHQRENTKMPRPGDINFDKVVKVRKFSDDLKTKFPNKQCPNHEKAVSEAMIKYKGPKAPNPYQQLYCEAMIKYEGCTFPKQYMPMKPIKSGIKMECKADSTEGYL